MELSNVSVLDTRRKILLNTPHIDTSVGDLVTFNTDLSAPLKSCKVSFSPVQEGEGDPSPDNVREIKGWNGVEVNRCGKNLIKVSEETRAYAYVGGSATNYTENNNTIIISGTSNGGYSVSCKPNTQYTYSCEPSLRGNGVFLRVWELEEEYNSKEISSGYSINQKVNSKADSIATFTTKANTHYLVVGFYIYSTAAQTGLTISDFQLELGDTRTAYEPYQGTTTSIDWTDSAGTVYGGYVDLVSGELVAEWYSVSTTAWKQYNQSNGYKAYRAENQPNHASGIPMLCNMVSKYGSFNSGNMTGNAIQPHSTIVGGVSTIYLGLDENIDISNVQVVWKLTEPIHYQLTPQQLLTLKGINNVYSDANGQTEIKYWKH